MMHKDPCTLGVNSMDGIDFDPVDYERACTSVGQKELRKLATHKSKYVRARVAGNPAIDLPLRLNLRFDESRGVVAWLIANPILSKGEYDAIFADRVSHSYCSIIHPVLATSKLASVEQLRDLQHMHQWNVDICILNNYHKREGQAYQNLIARYLPAEEKAHKEWTELEKLGYLRTYNRRLPAFD